MALPPLPTLINGLKEKGCGAVTEGILMDVCRETTPEKYKDRTMEILDRMKTSTKA